MIYIWQLIIIFLITAVHSVSAEEYYQRADVQDYIEQMVKSYDFDRAELERSFKGVIKQERAIAAMERPAESKPWHEYRNLFVTAPRVDGGVSFWRQHQELLAKAETEFGVPAALIVAIIGVESFYGRYTGKFPVFNTLVTLSFDYPRRSDFFKRELSEFLLLCRQESALQCEALKGSYAGAMGVGQFISSSYRAYAIDFDGDGSRDLWNSSADAIGSIGNYIKRHGWKVHQTVGNYAELSGAAYDTLLNKQLKPWLTRTDLEQRGIAFKNFEPPELKFALFKFNDEDTPDPLRIWIGYNNFYVITRYNHSYLYAMAVHQLSQLIKERYQSKS